MTPITTTIAWALVGLMLPLLVIIAVGAVVVRVVRRRLQTLPQNPDQPPGLVRGLESVAITCGSGAVVCVMAATSSYLGDPNVAEPIQRLGWYLVAAGVGCVLIGAVISLRWSGGWSVTWLTITLFAGLWAMAARIPDLPKSILAEVEQIPVPLTISLYDGGEPAEITINGVPLGQTPLHTTIDELKARVPHWDEIPEEAGPRFVDGGQQWASAILAWHAGVTGDLERWTVYVKLTRNGELVPGIGGGSGSGGGRHYGKIQPVTWSFSVHARDSFTELHELFQRARLMDYQVDADWIAAFDTFGPAGWDRLLNEGQHEPGLLQVRDDVAVSLSGLQSVIDGQQTVEKFLTTLGQRAVERQSYGTNTADGRAVEVLLETHRRLVDAEQLTRLAVDRIKASGSIPSGSRGYAHRPDGSLLHIATYEADGWDDDEFEVLPLAHAIWWLDVVLDRARANGEVVDNPVEREIVPLLLCLEYPNVDNAVALGGPRLETFLLRHNWSRTPGPHEYLPDVRRFMFHQYAANAWFHRLIRLPSETGRKFRRDQAYRIQKEIQDMLGVESALHSYSNVEDALEPLFIDDEARTVLAQKLWPDYDRMMVTSFHDRQQWLDHRWRYLARMWPVSTIDQFVDVYRRAQIIERLNSSLLNPLEALSPETRFAILEGLIGETRLLETQDLRPETRLGDTSIYQYHREYFEDAQRTLACPEAAEKLMAWFLSLEERHRESQRQNVIESIARNPGACEAFSSAESPELRLLVPLAVEKHPTKANRDLLSQLQNDSDARVRDAAALVADRLRLLSSSPLPRLQFGGNDGR